MGTALVIMLQALLPLPLATILPAQLPIPLATMLSTLFLTALPLLLPDLSPTAQQAASLALISILTSSHVVRPFVNNVVKLEVKQHCTPYLLRPENRLCLISSTYVGVSAYNGAFSC